MKKKLLILLLSACVALTMAGCGAAAKTTTQNTATDSQDQMTSSTTPTVSDSGQKYNSVDEKNAAEAAIRYAQDANNGSDFKALKIVVADDWAKVSIEETGVPRDEAVGYDVYVKMNEKGSWDVVASGTGLAPDDVPGAPGKLFGP
jgi:ABC-type amino acid transport substrate-binding protein